jgi:alkylation response protein AidB-like acyl-CoA dehydrogenase
MSSIDLEVDLGETEKAIHETVHRFAAEVMRPVGQELDKMPDPSQTIEKDSVVWDAMRQFGTLGIDTLGTIDSEFTPIEKFVKSWGGVMRVWR